jgi:hypothetical protein
MKRLLSVFAVMALIAAGCGGGDDSTPASGSKSKTTNSSTSSQGGGVETVTGDTQTDTGSDVEDQGY